MATDIIARGMITEYIAGTNINFTENRDGTVEISASGSISSEDSVARDAIGNHKSDTSNPHNVTPAQIGLDNVDNTSDLDKPISTAVQKAIDSKADKTVATTSADGLMSAEDKGKLDDADNTYALKSKYGDTTINLGRRVDAPIGDYSTSLGIGTVANGYASTAEGAGSQASELASHAGGYNSQAIKKCSFAHGYEVDANHDYETAFGKHNISNDDTLFSIGNGAEINTDGNISIARHNAFEITTTGGMLHDKDILTSAHCIQFIPYNLKYYALNDRILLFSNDDDVTRGIYFVNNTPNEITVCALISASAAGPAVQYGYGSSTYPEIQNTGEGREWFSEESIPTSPTIFVMTVPSGKLGYYGMYHNSETVYTTIHDIRCPYFNFF